MEEGGNPPPVLVEANDNKSDVEKEQKIGFQFISCLNIDETKFMVKSLIKDEDADYLIIAGNLAKFANEIPIIETFLEYVCSIYKGVYYMPGPQEYTAGPIHLGNQFCDELNKKYKNLYVFSQTHPSFIITVNGNKEKRIILIGAKFWGVHEQVFKQRAITIMETPKKQKNKKKNNMVILKQITNKIAEALFLNDTKLVKTHLERAKKNNDITIVVSHGTPYPSLMKEEYANSQMNYKLVTQVDTSLLMGELSPDLWIYGAPSGRWKVEGSTIEELNERKKNDQEPILCKTTFLCNPYNHIKKKFEINYTIKI